MYAKFGRAGILPEMRPVPASSAIPIVQLLNASKPLNETSQHLKPAQIWGFLELLKNSTPLARAKKGGREDEGRYMIVYIY